MTACCAGWRASSLQMRRSLALLNDVDPRLDRPLTDWIYPQAAFDDEARRAVELGLRETRIAQPAIGGVSLGLLHILADFGVRPDMTGGHSFGELTALCAAGRIDARSLLKLAVTRGEIMAACALESGEGAMLAVFAPADAVRRWCVPVRPTWSSPTRTRLGNA